MIFEVRKVPTGEYAKRHNTSEETTLKHVALRVLLDNENLQESDRLDSQTMQEMRNVARDTCNLLVDYFNKLDAILISIFLRFAKDECGKAYLSSDITPDTVVLRDKRTNIRFESKEKFYKRITK